MFNYSINNFYFNEREGSVNCFQKTSSYVSLNPRENSYYSFNQNMENLKDGFLVSSISYKKDFITIENDPHDDVENPRNKVLERVSTQEEIEFLKGPNSSW